MTAYILIGGAVAVVGAFEFGRRHKPVPWAVMAWLIFGWPLVVPRALWVARKKIRRSEDG